jgi:DNA polymerase V
MEAKYVNRTLNELIPLADELSEMEIEFAGEISAGFPSEAYDHKEDGIDFNKMLVRKKETTFCMIARGDCLTGDGIETGDMLVIDKLVEPFDNSLLIVSLNGEFTLKRLKYGVGMIELTPSNPKFETIIVRESEDEVRRWGVLTHVIKRFYPNTTFI